MPEIQLKTNIVKPLIWIYRLIYLAAASVIVGLVINQDMSSTIGLFWFILLVLAYQLTINHWLKLKKIQYVFLQDDGDWCINYFNGNQQHAIISANSILTSKLALLQFKISRLKYENVFIWRNSHNKQAYHALALWWNSAKTTNKE